MLYLDPTVQLSAQRYQIEDATRPITKHGLLSVRNFNLSHILKFGKSFDWISRCQIRDGVHNKETGRVITAGTGLSTRAIDYLIKKFEDGDRDLIKSTLGRPGLQRSYYFLNIPENVIVIHAIEAGVIKITELKGPSVRPVLQKHFGIPQSNFEDQIFFIADQVRRGYIHLNEINSLVQNLVEGRLQVTSPGVYGTLILQARKLHTWVQAAMNKVRQFGDQLNQRLQALAQYIEKVRSYPHPPQDLQGPTPNSQEKLQGSPAKVAPTKPCSKNTDIKILHEPEPTTIIGKAEQLTRFWKAKAQSTLPCSLVFRYPDVSFTSWLSILGSSGSIPEIEGALSAI